MLAGASVFIEVGDALARESLPMLVVNLVLPNTAQCMPLSQRHLVDR